MAPKKELNTNSWVVNFARWLGPHKMPVLVGSLIFIGFIMLGLLVINLSQPVLPPTPVIDPTPAPTPVQSATAQPSSTARAEVIDEDDLGFEVIGLPTGGQIASQPLILEAHFERPELVDSVTLLYRTANDLAWQPVDSVFEEPFVFRWNWGEAVAGTPFTISFDVGLVNRSILPNLGETDFPLQRVTPNRAPASSTPSASPDDGSDPDRQPVSAEPAPTDPPASSAP